MKTLLLMASIVLSGCATNSIEDAMELRIRAKIPMITKRKLSGTGAENVSSIRRDGYKKLPADVLYRYHTYKLRMVNISDKTCNAFFDYETDLNNETLNLAYGTLNEEEFDDYASIIAKAIVLGTNNEIITKPDQEAINKAYDEAIDYYSGEERNDLDRLTASSQNRTPADNCKVYKGLANYALKNKNTDFLIRYILSFY